MTGAWRAAAGMVALILTAGAAEAQGRADFGSSDNRREVKLFSPMFSVDLPVNAGTGYRWEFGSAHSRNVRLVEQGAGAAPGHVPGVVGYPTAQRFSLQATGASGAVHLGLFPPGPVRGEPVRVWRMTFHSAYAAPPPR